MILDRSLNTDDYMDFIGVHVTDELCKDCGAIIDFVLFEETRFGHREVVAVLDSGEYWYVSGIPFLDGILVER